MLWFGSRITLLRHQLLGTDQYSLLGQLLCCEKLKNTSPLVRAIHNSHGLATMYMNRPGSQSHTNNGSDVSSLYEGTPTSDPDKPSTPFTTKRPIERLFCTYTRFRHPLFISIGNELVDSIVGPMPTQQFLDDFFPISSIPYYSQPQFRKGCFQTTLDATDPHPGGSD